MVESRQKTLKAREASQIIYKSQSVSRAQEKFIVRERSSSCEIF
jgi:hypothetical protein